VKIQVFNDKIYLLKCICVTQHFFCFFFSGTYTNKSANFLTRELATHSYPCEEHAFLKCNPHTCCICTLLMIIAKSSRTGNYKRLNSNDISVRVIGKLGNSASSPNHFPFKTSNPFILKYVYEIITVDTNHIQIYYFL
jgi:hypothetical protein